MPSAAASTTNPSAVRPRFRVRRKRSESSTSNSFMMEPDDGGPGKCTQSIGCPCDHACGCRWLFRYGPGIAGAPAHASRMELVVRHLVIRDRLVGQRLVEVLE